MTSPPIPASKLLEPVVDAARRALRRLKPEEVPPALRKVASYSGGRLPPPLHRTLVRELDGNEWLREKVTSEWPEADVHSEGALGASALFLLRPEGWEFRLGRIEGLVEATEVERASHDLARQLAEARSREAEARRRLQETRTELAEAQQQARQEVEEARLELRSLRQSERRADDVLEERVSRLEAAKNAAERAHAEVNRLADRLKERLRIAQRDRAEAESRLQRQGVGSVWVAADPLAMARRLDEMAAAAQSATGASDISADDAEEPADGLVLPPGASPDGANSIDWLMRQGRALTLLVDGYNVGFLLDENRFATAEARDRLNHELSRLKLLSKTPIQVVVVYDSAVSNQISSEPGPGGVEVRYTSAGLSADEEIRRLARETPGPLVVVSSDREVREGSEAYGALGLWGEGLAAWIRKRA